MQHPTSSTAATAAVPAEKPSSMADDNTNEHVTVASINTISVNEKQFITEDEEHHYDKETASNKETIHPEDENQKQVIDDDFEEVFYGWLVVLGAFCVQVTSFGTATSWGVMQDYFNKTYFGSTQQLNLSFVGTLALIFTNLCGPLAQILTSMWGSRVVMIIGTLCVTLGLILAGFATQIWHLYLTQGILFGIGASLMYCTIMGMAPLWFNKRRGIALGIVASGSGIGGLVIPFIMTPINSSLGPGWTYRILGFICLACDLVAVVLVRPRVPVPTGQRKKLSDIIQLGVLKDKNFLLFCIGSMIALFGYFIPYFFLPSFATDHGFSRDQGSALVAVSSACNFIGRIIAGMCADRIGKLNTNILFTVMGGLSSLLIWTFVTTYGVLMAYAVVFGVFCGSYFALLSPITAQILGFERFPTGLSVMLLSNIISVFGPNIASAIEVSAGAAPYFTYKMFSGVAYLTGAVILFTLKLRLDRNIFAKV